MKHDGKPRIRKFPLGGWVCADSWAFNSRLCSLFGHKPRVAYGETPVEAYETWVRNYCARGAA